MERFCDHVVELVGKTLGCDESGESLGFELQQWIEELLGMVLERGSKLCKDYWIFEAFAAEQESGRESLRDWVFFRDGHGGSQYV